MFHCPWLEQNLSLHPISKALSFQCALKINPPFYVAEAASRSDDHKKGQAKWRHASDD